MSEESIALTPIEEKIVTFYDDEIVAVLAGEGNKSQVFVPLRQICDYLGLSCAGQRERINRDPVLSQEVRFVRVTRTNRGGNPELLFLPLKFLNGWLFGVSASRVKPELQEKIIRYQRECYDILWQAFQTDAFAVVNSEPTSLLSPNILALEQIRDMSLSIARMAEQQVELEKKVESA